MPGVQEEIYPWPVISTKRWQAAPQQTVAGSPGISDKGALGIGSQSQIRLCRTCSDSPELTAYESRFHCNSPHDIVQLIEEASNVIAAKAA